MFFLLFLAEMDFKVRKALVWVVCDVIVDVVVITLSTHFTQLHHHLIYNSLLNLPTWNIVQTNHLKTWTEWLQKNPQKNGAKRLSLKSFVTFLIPNKWLTQLHHHLIYIYLHEILYKHIIWKLEQNYFKQTKKKRRLQQSKNFSLNDFFFFCWNGL
jgi:hypothetical protein